MILCFLLSASLSSSAQCDVDTSLDMYISNPGGTVTWNTDMNILGNVYVEPATRLVITGNITITMCRNARIIVKRGARLDILSSTITGDPTWEGIEVWGNPEIPHPPYADIVSGVYPSLNAALTDNEHGVVFVGIGGFDTGSTLEHAHNAITTRGRTYDPVSQCYYTDNDYFGGIIVAQRATFNKNRRSIELMRFTESQNVSRFEFCDFKHNGFNPYWYHHKAYVTMWDVHGVLFNDCNFNLGAFGGIGFAGGGLESTDIGLESLDADYIIDGCNFEWMFRGILAENTMVTSGKIVIKNSYFYRNARSIYLIGVENAEVITNDIEFHDPYPYEEPNYGIYLDGCNAYQVEDNTIGYIPTTFEREETDVAILVHLSGQNANEIYRNTVTDFYNGVVAQQNNVGLQIKCNDFQANDQYSVAVTSGGIFPLQGICDGFSTGPAGNRFHHTCPTDIDGDYFLESGVPGITYAHHNVASYEPVCYTTTVSLMNCGIGTNGSCPDMTEGEPNPEGHPFPNKHTMVIDATDVLLADAKLQLEQETSGTQAYKVVEDEIAYLNQQKALQYNRFIREGMSNGNINDLLTELEAVNTHIMEKRLIEIYTGLGDYATALQKLNTLTKSSNSDQLFYDYYHTVLTILNAGLTYFDMNAQQESVIRQIAASNDPIARKAQVILSLVFGEKPVEVFELQSPTSKRSLITKESSDILKIYPNPASKYLFFDLSLDNKEQAIEWKLIDVYGKTVKTNPITLQAIQRNYIDVVDVAEGLYILLIQNEEGIIASQKVQIYQ